MAWTGYSEQGTGSQERGPGSFALQVPGVVEQRALPTPGAPRAGLNMGGVGGGLSVGQNQLNIGPVPEAQPAKLDPTFQTLLKLGGEFFADKVQKLEQARFIEGMHQAASGQALVDIINERPAWARVFGDGGAAEGARAYAADAAISEWAASVQQQMPELRKRSPDEVPRVLNGMLDGLMTGDAKADMEIRGAMLKQVPQIIKTHTREHIAWQQEEAAAQQGRAFVSAASAADAIMRDERATPQDRRAALDNLNNTMGYAEGMNLETWAKNVEGVVKHAAQSNQFQVLAAMQDPEKGVLGALPPAMSAALTSYIREQAKRYRSDNPPPDLINHGNMVMAQMERNVIPATVGLEQLAAINAEYKRASGNIIDLFDADTVGASLQTSAKSFYAARQAEEERINRERAKAAGTAAEAALEDQRRGALMNAAYVGQLHRAIAKPKEKEDALALAWRQAAGTDKGYNALMLNWQQDVKSDQVAAELQAAWRASLSEAGPGPNFITAYNQWKKFNFTDAGEPRFGAAGASPAYFGSDMDSAMHLFHSMTAGSMTDGRTDPAINDLAWNATRGPRPELLKDQKETAAAEVRSALSTGGVYGAFMTKPKDATVKRVLDHIAPLYAQYVQVMEPEAATRAAINAAKGNGLEIYGDVVVQRAPGQKPLTSTGVSQELMGAVLQSSIDAATTARKIDGAQVTKVIRYTGDNVRLGVIVMDKNGTPHTVTLTGDDLKAMYNKRQSAPANDGALQFGPKITYSNPTGYPGIYASPEALKAYHEQQRK